MCHVYSSTSFPFSLGTASRQPTINTLRGRVCGKGQGCNPTSGAMYLGEDETDENVCDPSTINLADYDQWVDETGYWIGEYTFLKEDGTPYTSARWPYRYDSYKGFITGSVKRNAYRQRNVFIYPPQLRAVCDAYPADVTTVIGRGTCGINGNTKLFSADQNATDCDGGNIDGLYAGLYPTKTTLIGKRTLLYQVWYNDSLIQSQLTTITKDSGQTYRTRTAQGFDHMTQLSNSVSYYRERKVTKDVFYTQFSLSIVSNNIRVQDLCKMDPTSEEVGSIEKCVEHLENSFVL
ncbi:hypothetical protein HJC23_012632 [Cyclotella cryptica]|uniref:Uncharacterized protein n=1 Tax=Cyclotella cryptica TaxID=29204 RepID=A0ABD3QM59_9STRA|eukprot:CCRYP_004171-RB/>CCRYP_004171-RB protein AED:0.01 eAED:0.01 QI:482/1/1/1/1/1/2/131/291